MSYAESRRQYGREEYHRPSRFLSELPLDVVEEVRVTASFRAPNAFKASVVANDSGFRLGEDVHHAQFGAGVILAIEGQGAHTRVHVKFSDVGTKWLVLAYANLERAIV